MKEEENASQPLLGHASAALSTKVSEMPVMPEPASVPWFKNTRNIIIIVVVLLLVVGGAVGLIVALSASSNPCKSSGDNLCTCSGVEFPVIIDNHVRFHNLTFSNAEESRLKTNNCNNTETTYDIFK